MYRVAILIHLPYSTENTCVTYRILLIQDISIPTQLYFSMKMINASTCIESTVGLVVSKIHYSHVTCASIERYLPCMEDS